MLIGLSGAKEAGKDTVYGIIKDLYEDQYTRVIRDAFADRLKISAARALGFGGTDSEAIDWCNEIKEPGVTITISDEFLRGPVQTITGRQYLQWYGTEAHREVFDYDFWINAVLPARTPEVGYGRPDLKMDDTLVITDVRFENEAQRILDLKGWVYRVRNDKAEAEVDGHASEQPLPDDLIAADIDNNGTLDDLREVVIETFGPLFEFADQTQDITPEPPALNVEEIDKDCGCV